MFNENDYKDFKAEIYKKMDVDSDDTLIKLGQFAKMLLKLNQGEKLSKKEVRYLKNLIGDAEDALKDVNDMIKRHCEVFLDGLVNRQLRKTEN